VDPSSRVTKNRNHFIFDDVADLAIESLNRAFRKTPLSAQERNEIENHLISRLRRDFGNDEQFLRRKKNPANMAGYVGNVVRSYLDLHGRAMTEAQARQKRDEDMSRIAFVMWTHGMLRTNVYDAVVEALANQNLGEIAASHNVTEVEVQEALAHVESKL
jgi:hypothetical protein